MMWVDQLCLANTMQERIKIWNDQTYGVEVGGEGMTTFEEFKHDRDTVLQVVMKKNMTESQAMEVQLRKEMAAAETVQSKNENPEETKQRCKDDRSKTAPATGKRPKGDDFNVFEP